MSSSLNEKIKEIENLQYNLSLIKKNNKALIDDIKTCNSELKKAKFLNKNLKNDYSKLKLKYDSLFKKIDSKLKVDTLNFSKKDFSKFFDLNGINYQTLTIKDSKLFWDKNGLHYFLVCFDHIDYPNGDYRETLYYYLISHDFKIKFKWKEDVSWLDEIGAGASIIEHLKTEFNDIDNDGYYDIWVLNLSEYHKSDESPSDLTLYTLDNKTFYQTNSVESDDYDCEFIIDRVNISESLIKDKIFLNYTKEFILTNNGCWLED
ncbi:MAG: hypothetical protein CL846_04010 [Crocinitomicaceae bacterium]|nr:hypothetical protein [Crocinitomicaceae bacterium]